jgi:hypothetical protein
MSLPGNPSAAAAAPTLMISDDEKDVLSDQDHMMEATNKPMNEHERMMKATKENILEHRRLKEGSPDKQWMEPVEGLEDFHIRQSRIVYYDKKI